MLFYKSYESSPDKEWVVFLHGIGGSSSVWFKQIRDFKKDYNVLMLDLRGHGRSQGLDSTNKPRYSFQEVSADVLDVMDELNIEKAHFVGLSLGTVIIRVLAEMDQSRIQSMIMGGAITSLGLKAKLMFKFGNILKRLMPYMWLYSFFAHIVMPRRHHAEARNIFINEASKSCYREFRKWYRLMAVDMNPLIKGLWQKKLHLPTLFIMGEQDYIFLPEVRKVVKRNADHLIDIIKGAGHVCNVDMAEEFNRRVKAFIQQHSLVPNQLAEV